MTNALACSFDVLAICLMVDGLEILEMLEVKFCVSNLEYFGLCFGGEFRTSLS